MAELSRKLSDLEGDERALADESRVMAKEVDGELGRRMEAQQGDFQARAKPKLDQIQRKLAGGVPHELGSTAETATEAARENVRQLRRLLPAKEWNEAQREAERLADGLGHLQHLVGRQRAYRRLTSPAVESFAGQVDDAAGLARELAADLGHVVPRGSDVMSADQRSRSRSLAQRQGNIEERTRGLSHDLASRDESAPGVERAAPELEEIAGQMRQTGQDLQDGAAHEGAGRASEVADRLAELRKGLARKPNEGGRSSREPVRIPDADAYQAPREWRQELMEAMREKAPEKYREQVRRYYEELVR